MLMMINKLSILPRALSSQELQLIQIIQSQTYKSYLFGSELQLKSTCDRFKSVQLSKRLVPEVVIRILMALL